MKLLPVATFLLGVLGIAAIGCGAHESRVADPAQLAANARVACADVPDGARQQLHAQLADVEAHHVDRIEGRRQVGRTSVTTTAGARIFLKAQPGLTIPWLQRVVACESAEVAARGTTSPDTALFAVPGATTEIRAAYGGFTMDVKGSTGDESREVLRRAVAMTTQKSLPTGVAQNESTPIP
jgi:hypothetical protein